MVYTLDTSLYMLTCTIIKIWQRSVGFTIYSKSISGTKKYEKHIMVQIGYFGKKTIRVLYVFIDLNCKCLIILLVLHILLYTSFNIFYKIKFKGKHKLHTHNFVMI